MSTSLDLAVQSYCFRDFKKNGDVAKMVREIGVDKVEICRVHADTYNPAAFRDAVKVYRDAGLSIISIGVETLEGNEKERALFECAAIAGARHISVHFTVANFPKAIAQAQKLSDEFGVRVGIHCHGGYSFGGQPDVLDHLIKLGAPQVGLCLDTAWCLQIGPHLGKPVEWVKRYAGHIYGVHYKDFTFARDGQWTDVVTGEGNLDLRAFVHALEAASFDGAAIIEYEGDLQNPVPALKKCVNAVRNAGNH